MIKILLIDDEHMWLRSFSRTLISNGIIDVAYLYTASSWSEALPILQSKEVDLVFLDLILGDDSGEEFLEYIMMNHSETSVVVMSGVDNIQTAVNCIKIGALDYFNKALSIEELLINVKRVIKMCELQKENNALKNNILLDDMSHFKEFLTINPVLLSNLRYLTAIASSSGSILITGESGTGKSMLAKAIAEYSRPGMPFVSVNVAGLDQHMFTDTLFGHAKGAFTGADSTRSGMIQKTADGTILLDEIGELPIPSQLTLLYITQNGEYQQLGSDSIKHTQARFIFATNQNMEEKCRTGQFRKDLYYRLKMHHIHIPPLRERREDIPLLLEHFVNEVATELRKQTPVVDKTAISLLLGYDFPGNVRELHAIIYDIIAKSSSDVIIAKDLEEYIDGKFLLDCTASIDSFGTEEALPTVEEMTMQLIYKAMELSDGNQRIAASLIGISQPTLSRRLKGKE